jgi:hypothetical protein
MVRGITTQIKSDPPRSAHARVDRFQPQPQPRSIHRFAPPINRSNQSINPPTNPKQAATAIPVTATEAAATTEAQLKKWFPLYKPLASPRLRVLCFPNAGSAENIYTGIANRNKQRSVPRRL